MNSFFKNIMFVVLNAIAPKLDNRASILMYHSISDRKDYFSAISSEAFKKQMAYIAGKKYPVISLAELTRRLRAKESLGGSVILTFDDGYRDNYTIVFPLLQQYGFPATIFVTTDFIDKEDKRNIAHCTAEELQEMHVSSLISIEPHTLTHPKLSKISRDDADREIRESRRVLQDILGATPALFAYPYGDFSEETIGVVREIGFIGAVTVEEGTVGLDTDLFRLPRNSIDRSTTFTQFRGKVSRAIDWYTSLKVLFRI